MVCVMMCRSEMQVSSFGDARRSLSMRRVTVLDLDDLAVFRAHTSAQTAAKHINLHSVRLPCRPPQARTTAVTHLTSAPPAHPMPYGGPGRTRRRGITVRSPAHVAHKPHAPAHQRARKQAPQSVAQWLLPFSRTVPPRSSRTRPSVWWRAGGAVSRPEPRECRSRGACGLPMERRAGCPALPPAPAQPLS